MDFPISDLMSEKLSTEWILEHFHPNSVVCVHCGAPWSKASEFRRTRKSELIVYRCRDCGGIYNLYSGTIFAARQLRPSQVVLLMRGVLKGESAMTLARELGMSRTTVTVAGVTTGKGRRTLQADALLVLVGGVPSWDLLVRAGIRHPGAL